MVIHIKRILNKLGEVIFFVTAIMSINWEINVMRMYKHKR